MADYSASSAAVAWHQVVSLDLMRLPEVRAAAASCYPGVPSRCQC